MSQPFVRRPIPSAAGAGLKARYLAQAAAQQDLTTFLTGITTALDIAPEDVAGFDDDTNELLLHPPPDDPPDDPAPTE